MNPKWEIRVCYDAVVAKRGNIVISHHSAAAYWLHAGSSTSAPKRTDFNPLENCASTSAELQDFDIGFPGFGNRPVHLLVTSKRLARKSRLLMTHPSEVEFPPGSFVELGNGLFVASPELCVVQMSRYLTSIQVSELGMNLCADYFIHPLSGKINDRKRAITTPESLAAYARSCRLYGSEKASRGLRLVLSGSRSPMETKVSLLLRERTKSGGEGLPAHVLNRRVDAESHSGIVEQDKLYIDFAYEDSAVGVEYYGEEFHKDAAKDRRRINALSALGWKMLTLERQQLYNPGLFELFTNQLARHLGLKKVRPWDWTENNKMLRGELGIV